MSNVFVVGVTRAPGVPLNLIESNAFENAKKMKAELEREGFIPGAYYHHHNYRDVRGPYFFWCVGCNSGPSSGGDSKAWMIVAAIVAALASIVTLVQSYIAWDKSKVYAKNEADVRTELAKPEFQGQVNVREKEIYLSCETMLKEAGAERKTSAVAIFILGGGLALLSIGLLMAYAANNPAPVAETLIVYGAGASGLGLIGYGVVQLHYKLVREPKINTAYVDLSRSLAELEAKQTGKTIMFIALIKNEQDHEELANWQAEPPSIPAPADIPQTEGVAPPAYQAAPPSEYVPPGATGGTALASAPPAPAPTDAEVAARLANLSPAQLKLLARMEA